MNLNFSYTRDTVEGNLLIYTTCPLCGKYQTITIKRGKEQDATSLIYEYTHDRSKCIQDIFTDEKCEMTFEEDATLVREFFIDGVCDDCFKAMESLEEPEDFDDFAEFEEDVVITSQDLKEYMNY